MGSGNNAASSPRLPIFDPAPASATRKFVLPTRLATAGPASSLFELPPFAYAGPVTTLAVSPAYPVQFAAHIIEVAVVTVENGLSLIDTHAAGGGTDGWPIVPSDLVTVEVNNLTPDVTILVQVNGVEVTSVDLGAAGAVTSLTVVVRVTPDPL